MKQYKYMRAEIIRITRTNVDIRLPDFDFPHSCYYFSRNQSVVASSRVVSCRIALLEIILINFKKSKKFNISQDTDCIKHNSLDRLYFFFNFHTQKEEKNKCIRRNEKIVRVRCFFFFFEKPLKFCHSLLTNINFSFSSSQCIYERL